MTRQATAPSQAAGQEAADSAWRAVESEEATPEPRPSGDARRCAAMRRLAAGQRRRGGDTAGRGG